VFGVGYTGDKFGDFRGGEGAVGRVDHGDENFFDSPEFQIFLIDFGWSFDIMNGDKFFNKEHFLEFKELQVEFGVSEDIFFLGDLGHFAILFPDGDDSLNELSEILVVVFDHGNGVEN
jgi:hypothetical protein